MTPMDDTDPRDDLPPALSSQCGDLNAELVVRFYENARDIGGDLIPVITVTRPGRMTMGRLDLILPKLYAEIQLAQLRKSQLDEAAQKAAAHA